MLLLTPRDLFFLIQSALILCLMAPNEFLHPCLLTDRLLIEVCCAPLRPRWKGWNGLWCLHLGPVLIRHYEWTNEWMNVWINRWTDRWMLPEDALFSGLLCGCLSLSVLNKVMFETLLGCVWHTCFGNAVCTIRTVHPMLYVNHRGCGCTQMKQILFFTPTSRLFNSLL